MKTSFENLKHMEAYLSGKLSVPENLLFKAKLLLDPVLRENVALQQKTYSIVKLYGRKTLKNNLETVHRQLFSHPGKKAFQEEIQQLFR